MRAQFVKYISSFSGATEQDLPQLQSNRGLLLQRFVNNSESVGLNFIRL